MYTTSATKLLYVHRTHFHAFMRLVKGAKDLKQPVRIHEKAVDDYLCEARRVHL